MNVWVVIPLTYMQAGNIDQGILGYTNGAPLSLRRSAD